MVGGRRRWAGVCGAWSALLAEASPTSFLQSPEWAHALSDELHTDAARWFVAEDDDGPLAVLPFKVGVRRLGPLRVRVLASERLTDGLVAVRARPPELRDALLAAAAEAGEPVDVLTFNGLRPGMGLLRLASASALGLETEHRHGGFSVIETTVTGDEWFAGASKNLRAGLRKARNRSEGRGEVAIAAASGPDEVAAGFDAFVAIEATGWKAGTDALANRPAQRAAMRRYFVDAACGGRSVVRTLHVGGRLAAAQLATVTGRTLALVKVAYDNALSDLSPSNLLMADLVRACCDRSDIDRIDLVTNQPWHDRWHAVEHPTYKARDLNARRVGGLVSRVGVAMEGAGVRLPGA